MEVKLAKTAGFCFGVKRAMEQVYEQIGKGEKIYTYGPIIHNEEVVKELEKKGVTVIYSDEELSSLKEGIIVIRSHGVSKEIFEKMQADPDKQLTCENAQVSCRIAIGYAHGESAKNPESLIQEADKQMYLDKHSSRT